MTPSVSNSQGNGYTRDRGQEGAERPTLVGQSENWTTPKASDGEKGGPNMRGSKGDLPLPAQSAQWPTPDTSRRGTEPPEQVIARRTASGAGGLPLQTAAEYWPTPTAALMNDGEDPAQWQARADRLKAKGTNGNGAGMPLTVASAAWPTPAARDYRTPNSTSYQDRSGTSKGEQLVNFVAHHFSPPARLTEPGQTSSPQPRGSLQLSASKSSAMPRPLSRRLNPFFVEWLMGWPLGWTSTTAQPVSSASATEWYRSRLQLHLSSLFGELAMNDSGQSTHRRAA